MDILGARLSTRGSMLELEIMMREVSALWSPLNGFDHTTFQIFIDDPHRSGATLLPGLSAGMPTGLDWDFFVFATGWNTRLSSSAGADAHNPGRPLSPAPAVRVDPARRTIRFTLPQAALETTDFTGWRFYITSWDFDGISGNFRPLTPQGGQWAMGGGDKGDPLIMDSLLLEVP
jgi:hypothetical protein